MKRMLALLSSLTLLTPLSINLYSCNNSDKEDPKVSQQKVDELVELFNYYNEHNDASYVIESEKGEGGLEEKFGTLLYIQLKNSHNEFYKEYLSLQLEQKYELSLQEILLNSIIFDAYYYINFHIIDENGILKNEEYIKKQLKKFNFLRLNWNKSEKYVGKFEASEVTYWENVWNNNQMRVIANDDKILEKIRNEKKGIFPCYELIELKLQYIQKDGTVITSKNYFKVNRVVPLLKF